jgi:adenosylcobinamide-phosphate synthase
MYNYLGAGIRIRLKQNRIHVNRRFKSARHSLHRLCSPNFAAIGCYGAVESHVLRFKWTDTHTAALENSTKGGDKHALPGVGRRALNHDRFSSHVIIVARQDCENSVNRAIALFLGSALDQIFGEVPRWHPLVGFGQLASIVEDYFLSGARTEPDPESLKMKGAISVAILIVPFFLLVHVLTKFNIIGPIVEVACVYLAIGHKSLVEHARNVATALQGGNLEEARHKLSLIVSRDTSVLDETGVARATIESVLENGNDAVYGAIFWFLLLGAPGVVAYRLSNTLDAMWGYKNERFLYFGWAAAKFDDLLNYIPARITAYIYGALGNFKQSMHCLQTQAPEWYSPNAGPVMAAGAGSLGLILGGPAIYHGVLKERPTLGEGKPPDVLDIERALQLMTRTFWVWEVVALLGSMWIA